MSWWPWPWQPQSPCPCRCPHHSACPVAPCLPAPQVSQALLPSEPRHRPSRNISTQSHPYSRNLSRQSLQAPVAVAKTPSSAFPNYCSSTTTTITRTTKNAKSAKNTAKKERHNNKGHLDITTTISPRPSTRHDSRNDLSVADFLASYSLTTMFFTDTPTQQAKASRNEQGN